MCGVGGVVVVVVFFNFILFFAVLVLRTLEPNPDFIGADDNRSRVLFVAAFHLRLVSGFLSPAEHEAVKCPRGRRVTAIGSCCLASARLRHRRSLHQSVRCRTGCTHSSTPCSQRKEHSAVLLPPSHTRFRPDVT